MQQSQRTLLLAAIVTRLAAKADRERLVAAEHAILDLQRRIVVLEARPTDPPQVHLVETRRRPGRTPTDPSLN